MLFEYIIEESWSCGGDRNCAGSSAIQAGPAGNDSCHCTVGRPIIVSSRGICTLAHQVTTGWHCDGCPGLPRKGPHVTGPAGQGGAGSLTVTVLRLRVGPPGRRPGPGWPASGPGPKPEVAADGQPAAPGSGSSSHGLTRIRSLQRPGPGPDAPGPGRPRRPGRRRGGLSLTSAAATR